MAAEYSSAPALYHPAEQVRDQSRDSLQTATLEAHVAVDHASYPTDPIEAARWSTGLRRVLEL